MKEKQRYWMQWDEKLFAERHCSDKSQMQKGKNSIAGLWQPFPLPYLKVLFLQFPLGFNRSNQYRKYRNRIENLLTSIDRSLNPVSTQPQSWLETILLTHLLCSRPIISLLSQTLNSAAFGLLMDKRGVFEPYTLRFNDVYGLSRYLNEMILLKTSECHDDHYSLSWALTVSFGWISHAYFSSRCLSEDPNSKSY